MTTEPANDEVGGGLEETAWGQHGAWLPPGVFVGRSERICSPRHQVRGVLMYALFTAVRFDPNQGGED